MNVIAKVDVVMADEQPAPVEAAVQEPETADVAPEAEGSDHQPVQRISRRTGKTVQPGE